MSSPSPPPLRIGILGAARIARKTIAAIQHDASRCVVVAVASRSAAKAKTLVDEHMSPEHRRAVQLFSGPTAYHDLVTSTNIKIDAVYIPLPTRLKKEWTICALRNGKHVLIEKPVAPSVGEYREMMEEARSAKRYLMDGTMFVNHPRTHQILSILSNEEDQFGDLHGIDAAFTLEGNEDFMKTNIRMKKDCDFQGCIGDLGWYCIRLAQLACRRAGRYVPKSAKVSEWKVNEEGVPIDASCWVSFQPDDMEDANPNEDGNKNDATITLSFHCSYLHPWSQRGDIRGSKQTIQVLGYINPQDGPVSYQVIRNHSSRTNLNESTIEDKNSVHTVSCEVPQITLMWRKFFEYCEAIEKNDGWNHYDGGDEATTLSKISEENQLVVDALMESLEGSGKIVHFSKENQSMSLARKTLATC